MTDGTPKQFRWSLSTTQVISLFSRTDSSTKKGVTPIRIGWPGEGTCWYRPNLSAFMCLMVTRGGVDGVLVPFPHP